MGQKEVLELLKKNPGQYFDAGDIKKIVGSNIQTVYSILKKLEKSCDVKFKAFNTTNQGMPKKLYAYIKKDNFFEEALHEYKNLKAEPRFTNFMPSEVLTSLMAVKELKEIKEMLKDGRKE
jgi:hypothetical protein